MLLFTVIVQADMTADRVAKDNGWERIIFPALGNKHRKATGPIRNEQMKVNLNTL